MDGQRCLYDQRRFQHHLGGKGGVQLGPRLLAGHRGDDRDAVVRPGVRLAGLGHVRLQVRDPEEAAAKRHHVP
eukprot:1111548-Lingulodinium_polyedra.AAC.1